MYICANSGSEIGEVVVKKVSGIPSPADAMTKRLGSEATHTALERLNTWFRNGIKRLTFPTKYCSGLLVAWRSYQIAEIEHRKSLTLFSITDELQTVMLPLGSNLGTNLVLSTVSCTLTDFVY